VLTTVDGRITRCNEAFRRFTCLPFGSLNGRQLAHVLGGGNAPPLSAEYYQATASMVQCSRAGWMLVRGFPIHRNAQLRAWVHALEELAPARLPASGHRPLIAIEQASDGIAVVDSALGVVYANPALAALLRLPRAQVVGESAVALGLLPEREGHEPALLPALRNGQRALRIERADGERAASLELSIGPVANSGGEIDGFVLVVRDVSVRERELRRAEAAAATSDLCQWLGGLRHELGNPINSVKMALTVLHSHLGEFSADEVVRYVERALSELGRVEYLLRSLKTFTLFDPPELQRVDMSSFVETAVAQLEPGLARQGIALERIREAPGSGPLIATADPRALHQVTVSLVNNAAEALDGHAGRIQIGAVRQGGAIELNVHDTGPGIAPAQLERLFLPFETTKRGNPGLGLTLVRRLVNAMHGTVSIESALGMGTRVRVRLDEVR
jgi:PAS domain S-box-containing protein